MDFSNYRMRELVCMELAIDSGNISLQAINFLNNLQSKELMSLF